MTPKEKAIELVSTFKPYADYTECDIFNQVERMHINAKIIALIAVDEILKEIDDCFLQQYDAVDRYYYYKEVKQEIKKL
jgi:hypothetical protein